MTTATIPPRQLDDRAFPIRVKLVDHIVGEQGARLKRAEEWLKKELGVGRYAAHNMDGYGAQTRAFYFREMDDLRRFLDAFKDCDLADGLRCLDRFRDV